MVVTCSSNHLKRERLISTVVEIGQRHVEIIHHRSLVSRKRVLGHTATCEPRTILAVPAEFGTFFAADRYHHTIHSLTENLDPCMPENLQSLPVG